MVTSTPGVRRELLVNALILSLVCRPWAVLVTVTLALPADG